MIEIQAKWICIPYLVEKKIMTTNLEEISGQTKQFDLGIKLLQIEANLYVSMKMQAKILAHLTGREEKEVLEEMLDDVQNETVSVFKALQDSEDDN